MVKKYFMRGRYMAKLNTDKLLEELTVKWNGRTCPLCGTGNWTIADKVFELREYNNGDLVLGGGPIIPIVPTTCDHCGNTVLVNPLVLKVFED